MKTFLLFLIAAGLLAARPARAQNQAVGVGTSTPAFTLQVKHANGTPAVTTNRNGLAVTHASGPTWVLYASATDNTLVFYRDGVKELVMTADGTVDNVSDSTRKTGARPLAPGQLASIMRLQPKTYRYKAQTDSRLQYGLMAQELATVYPDMVHHGVDDDGQEYWTVSYPKLIPVLIKGMQEQQEQLAHQQAQLTALQQQVRALSRRLPRR